MKTSSPLSLMDPLLITGNSKQITELRDLTVELASRAAALRRSLPMHMQAALADMIRAMNCYYSNLIEGHDTHPLDIERALKKDYSKNTTKRNLQLEARAHVIVQKWIDEGSIKGNEVQVSTLCEIHKKFYELMPEEMLHIGVKNKQIQIIPGELRRNEIVVGQHVPIKPNNLPKFLGHFAECYGQLGKSEAILNSAAMHHRFLWIHPFLDGNGRVARLMSHAIFIDRLDSGGLWSIARGLARNSVTYKELLSNCDLTRRNDLDGRGNLSTEALIKFTKFFLETCIDQVNFMESLIQPNRLRTRIILWAEEEIRTGNLPSHATQILEAILYRDEVPRGEIAGILGVSDRHARRIVSSLLEIQAITSDTPKSPLQLKFTATLAGRWMPGLFPDK